MGAVAEWMLERADTTRSKSIPHGVFPSPFHGIRW
jgi:hypothetical protein